MQKEIKASDVDFWTDSADMDSLIWDSEICLLNCVMTIDGEPSGFSQSFSIPDNKVMKFHTIYYEM